MHQQLLVGEETVQPDSPGDIIVWSIAGSDSGGGAGIQADLATFRDFGVHGCSVVTALTAQNSVAVEGVWVTPPAQVGAQIAALASDLPPAAIKLGMLVDAAIIAVVQRFLSGFDGCVIFDPVMRSTSGADLSASAEETLAAMRALLPDVDLLTPNIAEAEALTGLRIDSERSLRTVAQELLALGARSVLITGGHMPGGLSDAAVCVDFWTDGGREVYLSGELMDTPHTHGSGCTLSSALAALLARGYSMTDALVLARAYISTAIRTARGIGLGPGPVAHRGWPQQLEDWPGVSSSWPRAVPRFPACRPLGLYPVVDDVSWIERLLPLGVTTIQLRIKQGRDGDSTELRRQIARAVELARENSAQLFINDHWQLAIECGAFGVHLGQEDLDSADLASIARAGLRLGVSTHSDSEIARAHRLRPSYIAIGPIYETTTKKMAFTPRGLERLRRWVKLLRGSYPLTAIGGIDLARAPGVLATGVGSCAVVRAITEAADPAQAVRDLQQIHQRGAAEEPVRGGGISSELA